jgi:hypothetical protein
MNPIDNLHYQLLLLQNYVPSYVDNLNSYTHKNKLFESFIRHKVNTIITICNDVFVDEDGKCYWDNIETIRSRGFYIGPGEQDRFGWLTAILYTKKGDILFG